MLRFNWYPRTLNWAWKHRDIFLLPRLKNLFTGDFEISGSSLRRFNEERDRLADDPFLAFSHLVLNHITLLKLNKCSYSESTMPNVIHNCYKIRSCWIKLTIVMGTNVVSTISSSIQSNMKYVLSKYNLGLKSRNAKNTLLQKASRTKNVSHFQLTGKGCFWVYYD